MNRWALLVPAIMLIAACSSQSQPPGQASSGSQGQTTTGGVLRMAELAALPTVLHLYPQPQNNDTGLGDEMTLMGSGLIDLNWDTLDYVADPSYCLATALPTISPDGRTFTFTIRSDAKWSDGQPLTSDDFLFAWQNASNPDNNFVGLDTLQRIQSFTAPDAHTIQVTLDQTYARYVAFGTAAAIGPVPRHIWEGKPWYDAQGNPEIAKPTVVSGPFIPSEFTTERHTYVRNPNWWGKQPKLTSIEFVAASPSTALDLLKTKQVNWVESFPPDQYAEATSASNINVIQWTSVDGAYRTLEFNLKRPLLTDKRVREALARAINRQDLIQFENGLAVPQTGLFTSANTKWLNDSVAHYDFDLGQSRQLLQDAGFRLDGGVLRDATGQPVSLDILAPTSSQPRVKEATYIQQQWKQLGIDVSVTALEFASFVDKYARLNPSTGARDFDVAMGSYGGAIDPDDAKSQIKSDGAQNVYGYNNPTVDQLIAQGAQEQDDTQRKAIYDQMQQLVIGDLPFFEMVTETSFTAIDKSVSGVAPRKGGDVLRENDMQVLDWSVSQ